jgi:hypothetical protein
MRVPGALLAQLPGHLVAAGMIPNLLDLLFRQGVEGAGTVLEHRDGVEADDRAPLLVGSRKAVLLQRLVHQRSIETEDDVETVVDPHFVTVDILHQATVAGELHQALIAGNQLALAAKRDEVRFAHQADFEAELAGLDDRREDAARIDIGEFRIQPKGGQRHPNDAIRAEMPGQRPGDFALELFEHRRKRDRVGRRSLTGLLEIAQGL